ncbi:MAG: hypothetical protein Q8P95_04045 [bacterium]|nr:hypothetical protein [bacterium]
MSHPQATNQRAVKDFYQLILDRCYRANLFKDPVSIDTFDPGLFQSEDSLDNHLTQLIVPGITRLLDRGLFDLYQVLYSVDVDERKFKERVMDLKNTTMIPSVAAFMIIDRLKARYKAYPLLTEQS